MKKMNILGIDLDCFSHSEMYSLFDNWLVDKSSRSHFVATVNVNCCVAALLNPHLRCVYNSADLTGIDSMPFLRWARLFHNRASDRCYPPDMILDISEKAKTRSYSFFFYGGFPDSGPKLDQYFTRRYEGITVVGTYSPPFRPLTEEEDAEVCAMINKAQPDFLWIGLGSPKQDVWISEHRDKIRGTIMVASGATFDFLSGRIKQAPKWIRQSGFEWLYRLTRDFRRLWIRYTVYNFIFIFMFFLQITRLYRFTVAES